MNTHLEPHNLLLRKLPPQHREELLSSAELVHFNLREYLIEHETPIKYVEFPESGVISVLTQIDSRLVEIANVGYEGFIGIPILLGVDTIPEVAFCQVEGSGWRIPVEKFKQMLEKSSELNELCKKYLATFLNQVARNSGCNWSHSIEERCARWLLLTHDRVDGDEFHLTQEFLATMLGVTRGGVNLAAGSLAKANLITYVRGKITVLDRLGLEKSTCECYSSIRSYFDRTFSL
jgi:CRP-like cAMP-binding protein